MWFSHLLVFEKKIIVTEFHFQTLELIQTGFRIFISERNQSISRTQSYDFFETVFDRNSLNTPSWFEFSYFQVRKPIGPNLFEIFKIIRS